MMVVNGNVFVSVRCFIIVKVGEIIFFLCFMDGVFIVILCIVNVGIWNWVILKKNIKLLIDFMVKVIKNVEN